jgi:hypothetical protein
MNQTIQIPLPKCVDENTAKDLREGIELFFQTVVQKINFGIEGDLGDDDAKMRAAFKEFMMMRELLKRPRRVQSDDPEHDVFYLEDRAVELLRKLGV